MNVDMILIGCGGTGGCFFSKMARFLADTTFQNMNVVFRIMDGDHVEPKNLGRQPFIEEDIGKNKAVALASAAEEIMYLRPENQAVLNQRLFERTSSEDIQIVIGAVDNHACRKLLHEYFKGYSRYQTLFYIDAANEFSCGEIVIGKKVKSKTECPDRVHYYPDILSDTEKAPYEMSCEELNQAAPQHLATNSMAADLLFAYLTQILTAGDMASKAPGGIIYFDTFKLFSRFVIYKEEKDEKIKS